jgi:outer membrane protein OmpA-like peptidoglycan-associated protein
MNYPANGIEKNNGMQRTSGQFKHALWTWIVALVLAIYLVWQWQHGQGPASASACCIAINPNASTVANNALANFHFTASAKDGYQATGDASNITWTTKSADLSAWLKGGEDWVVTGDAANIKLTGTVESQEIKQAKGTEAQVFFGTGVTVDNQLQVKTAEATPSAVAVPTVVKLYFDTAKASLPADAKQSLAPIIEWLKTNTSAKAVISGYHDSHGSLASNQELAKNRAKAVSSALEDAGIDEDRIELRKPESTEGLGNPAEARRVEVSVE